MAEDAPSIEGRRIMVAVDESDESLHALRWCLQNLIGSASPAQGSPAKETLILVYARPSPPLYSPVDTTGFMFHGEVTASMDKYSKEVADAVMNRASSICKEYSNIVVETKICAGDARDVICESVNKFGADMLVMGSHGYGFIKRALLGSVSDHCARNARCPVVIVKRQSK